MSVYPIRRADHFVTTPLPENPSPSIPVDVDWHSATPGSVRYTPVPYRPSRKMLILACILFFLTFCTCLVAGTQFATAYSQNQAFSFDEFLRSFTLFYKHPLGLAAGLPFAFTLLTILLTHELGHFFACRYHHIRATYPFFVPFPNLNGTFGAFILIRSPILTNRALFDVGASGPLVGFVFALPALLYGVLHAKLVPGLANPANAEVIYGTPLLLRLLDALLHPGISPDALLLPPVGRAAWVGLFVTSLTAPLHVALPPHWHHPARARWFLGWLVHLGRSPSRHAIPPRRSHLRSNDSRSQAPVGSAPCSADFSPFLHARAFLLSSKFSLTRANLRL